MFKTYWELGNSIEEMCDNYLRTISTYAICMSNDLENLFNYLQERNHDENNKLRASDNKFAWVGYIRNNLKCLFLESDSTGVKNITFAIVLYSSKEYPNAYKCFRYYPELEKDELLQHLFDKEPVACGRYMLEHSDNIYDDDFIDRFKKVERPDFKFLENNIELLLDDEIYTRFNATIQYPLQDRNKLYACKYDIKELSVLTFTLRVLIETIEDIMYEENTRG